MPATGVDSVAGENVEKDRLEVDLAEACWCLRVPAERRRPPSPSSSPIRAPIISSLAERGGRASRPEVLGAAEARHADVAATQVGFLQVRPPQ